MKNRNFARRLASVLLGTATLVCVGLFAAACGMFDENNNVDDGGDGEDTATYYTVTLDFDAEKGSIDLSPTAADNKYEKDTAVTVTVTAKTNYAISAFTVDGTETELTEGEYSLTVTKDVTLSATFYALPVPAKFPSSYYGTFYRGTGTDIITIDEEGFKVGSDTCPVTTVENVYHVEWDNIDWIVTINPDSFSYAVLRLTKTADNGATEINFYRSDLDHTIAEETQGTWKDSAKNVTLVIGEKSLTWNGNEVQLIIIGTDSRGKADLFFLMDGNVVNLYYDQVGNTLQCYLDNTPLSQHTFVKQTASAAEIPDLFRGKFTGTTSEEGVEYTIIVDENSVTVNGTPATEISYTEGSNMKNLNFTVGNDKFVLSYIETSKEYDIDINDSHDYGVMTKEETSSAEELPEDLQGQYTLNRTMLEITYNLTIDVSANSVTISGTISKDGGDTVTLSGEEITDYSFLEQASYGQGVTFTDSGIEFTLYGESGYYGLEFNFDGSKRDIELTKQD